MFELRCQFCGRQQSVPNVLRCPYCNKDMSDKTDALTAKHIRKCAYYLSPYKYSERGPGRPKAQDVIDSLGLD